MKRLSVLLLIAVLALVGWALPAGAEKVRLTEDQMDNVSAGLIGWDFPRTFDISRGFDWGIGTGGGGFNQMSQPGNGTGGAGVGVHGGVFLQLPCQKNPAVLCLGGGGGASAGVGAGPLGVTSVGGPIGASAGGGGSLTFLNFGGPLLQMKGGGGAGVLH